MNNNTKSSHITAKQKEILMDFILKRPNMYRGKLIGSYTKEVSSNLWMELSESLNSVHGAPIKDWHQWRKSWVSLKKNFKVKLKNNTLKSSSPKSREEHPIKVVDEVENEITTMFGDPENALNSEHSQHPMNNTKRGHITPRQKQILINYIRKRPDMYREKFTSSYTKEKSFKLWRDITQILNNIPDAPNKDWRQWRKCWWDLKRNARTKLEKSRLQSSSNGIKPTFYKHFVKVENGLPNSEVGDSCAIDFDHNMNNNKKSGKITPRQKEILTDFLSKRPEMYNGKLTRTYTRERSFRLWRELTQLLNNVPGSPAKDWRQWKKSWIDLKKNTKAKLAKKVSPSKPDEYSSHVLRDNMENRLPEIVTPVKLFQNPDVPEYNVEFRHSEYTNDKGCNNSFVEAGSRENVIEYAYIDEKNFNPFGIITNHPVNRDAAESERVETKIDLDVQGDPVQKISNKIQLKARQRKMLSGTNRINNMQQIYYAKKLKLLERDINNRELYYKKNLELGEKLLKELSEVKTLLLRKTEGI